MLRSKLLSKIHRAVITETDLDYVGSITIDEDILKATGMVEFEQVAIFDIENGNRFETYILKGEAGSGIIGVNGAAARMVHRGDKIIVVNYGMLDETEMKEYRPNVVVIDSPDNKKWHVL